MGRDYSDLFWLSWRIFVHRLRLAVRHPGTYVFLAYGVFLAYLVSKLFSGPGLRPTQPLTFTAATLAAPEGILLLVVLTVLGYGTPFGMAAMGDREEFVVIVFGSPIAPASLLRSRLVAVTAIVAIVWSATAGFGAIFAGSASALSAPELAVRIWIATFPIVLIAMYGGMLAACHRGSPWSTWIGRLIAGVFGVAFVAFLIGLPPGGTWPLDVPNDRVVQALLPWMGPFARLSLGAPLHPLDGLAFLVEWGIVAVLVVLLLRTQYPVPGRFASPSTPPMTGLTPEAPPEQYGWVARLRGYLRPRYRDRGEGARAIEGLAWSLWLRTAEWFLTAMFAGMILFLGLSLGFDGAGASLFFPVLLLVMGVLFGLMSVSLSRGVYWPTVLDQARQSPVGSDATARALVAPQLYVALSYGVVVGIGAAVSSDDIILGVLTGLLLWSVLLLYLLFGMLQSPRFGYSAEDGGRSGGQTAVLYMMGMLSALIVPESIVSAYAPGPGSWDPLYLPFLAESAVNLLLAWVLIKWAARRTTAPAY
jgi:hypothetical protein